MSCGLFELLPEDTLNEIFRRLDDHGLCSAAPVCRTFRTRASTAELWKAQAHRFLDFNSVLSDEKMVADMRDSSNVGLCVIETHVRKRYDELKSSGKLKTAGSFCSMLRFEGHLSDYQMGETSSFSWKRIYQILAFLFNKKRVSDGPGVQNLCFDAIYDFFTQEALPAEMRVALCQALCTERISYDLLENMAYSSLSSVSDLLFENLVFLQDSWDRSAFNKIVAHFGSTIAASWLISAEFDQRNRQKMTPDNLMRVHTHLYLTSMPLEFIFRALMEQTGAVDLLSGVESFPQQLVKVIKTENRPSVRSELRGAAFLMLCLLGGQSNTIVSQIMGSGDSILEDLIVRFLLAEYKADPSTVRPLLLDTLKNVSSNPRARIQAGWILHKNGVDVSNDVTQIPGYPRPWTGAVPLPENIRHSILRQYGPDAERGSDLALLLEAALLGPSDYEDYEEIPTTSEIYDGIEIIGPISAGDLHQQGGGSYNVFKTYVEPDIQEVPAGPRRTSSVPFSVAVCCLCTFGPYAYVECNNGIVRASDGFGSMYIEDMEDVLRYSSGQLDSYEEVQLKMERWAEVAGYLIVPQALLECIFDGLNVYYFGRRAPLTIRNLLYYWQD